MNYRVLVTRDISQKQIDFCYKLGIKPIVEPFIKIVHLPVDEGELMDKTQNNPIWVFTSVNAVKVFSKFSSTIDVADKIAYAIGEKTEKELTKIDGLSVILKDDYAPNFFSEIKKEHPNTSVAYFCNNLSIEKNKHHILNFDVMQLYETQLLKKSVEENYDAITFFSPSAVKAFSKSGNHLKKELPVFAIGGPTMSEVFMHYQNSVIIPDDKKFESVMESVVEYFA